MAILFINRSDSRCGNCPHSSVLPNSRTHDMTYGWSDPKPGCGEEYTHVSSDYMGLDDTVKAMRPDLPFLTYEEAHRGVLPE